jgi:MFS transporter, OFA family, oxalate/formate antiporter
MNQSERAATSPLGNPWIQLAIGVICMACVANLQYGWTLFVNPIDAKYHWGRASIQVAFTTFVLIETWLIPVEGYLVDRFGPRWVVMGGGILVAIAWALNSVASSLMLLYVAAAIGGVGTGCVYGTCVGNALKWFPGRRGLAAGFTAAGFGAGAAITVAPIAKMIPASGYEHTFLFFGLLQGAIVFVMSWGLLVAPRSIAPVKANQSAHGYTPMEVLRSPVFYVMYVMFVLVAAGGLMMAASMAPIAKDLKIDKIPVEVLGMSGAALTMALLLNRIFDGVGRPFFGWVSDQIGRENTMAIAFLIGAGALFLLGHSDMASNPVMFVLVTAVYFGVFGEIYSLFPATQGDTFGAKYAASNAGMLYTAKGAGSLLVPFAAALSVAKGWPAVFNVAMCFNVVAALIGLFVLKPMRARHFVTSRAKYAADDSPGGAVVTSASGGLGSGRPA